MSDDISFPGPSFSDALEKYHRERVTAVRDNLPVLREELMALGVACVAIDYDGCGDSGQIEGVIFLDSMNQPVGIPDTNPLKERVRDLFYDLLETRYEGWEIDDGSFGEFGWCLAQNRLSHTHNARFTDYETTEVEGV